MPTPTGMSRVAMDEISYLIGRGAPPQMPASAPVGSARERRSDVDVARRLEADHHDASADLDDLTGHREGVEGSTPPRTGSNTSPTSPGPTLPLTRPVVPTTRPPVGPSRHPVRVAAAVTRR